GGPVHYWNFFVDGLRAQLADRVGERLLHSGPDARGLVAARLASLHRAGMTVLLVLHLMQVVIDGAYKAPREVNFWFGLVLLQLVLALSLTGYLLPWDQKGFWATTVATNLVVAVPVVGPALQKLIIGGTEYGHHTLTRFF